MDHNVNQASNENYAQKITWHAVYEDGSVLSQFTDNVETTSELIDKKKLRSFVLTTIECDRVILTQKVKPGDKLIYRARKALRPGQGQIENIHIVQIEHNGSGHVIFVHESDFVINIGDYEETNSELRWYHPVVKLPHDEVEAE